MASFALTFLTGYVVISPWPKLTAVRHIASFPNCAFARATGLAPAKRGEPGYWLHLDRDKDGVACEPWPRAGS